MSRVFANASEGAAWMHVWCEHCAHDHAAHTDAFDGANACPVVLHMMTSDVWPEAIIREPPGEFHLPPLHLCGMFTPCEPCGGDPKAEIRANVIAYVTKRYAELKNGPAA